MTLIEQKIVAFFSHHHKYTACFEANIEESGYVLVNMPLHVWQEMGEPKSIVVTYEPKSLSSEAKKLKFGAAVAD